MNLFMQIKGLTGPVAGPKHRVGWFKITSISWKVDVQIDPVTGQHAGQRVLAPFRVTRPVDNGSHGAMESLTRNLPLGGSGAVTVIAGDVLVAGVTTPTVTYSVTNAVVETIRYVAVRGGADDVVEEGIVRYASVVVKHDPSSATYQAL